MFIEAARWPDNSKFTNNDRLTWHTARWAVLTKDAPPEAKAAVAARRGKPIGQGLERMTSGTSISASTGRSQLR
jgi:hypothetical protein